MTIIRCDNLSSKVLLLISTLIESVWYSSPNILAVLKSFVCFDDCTELVGKEEKIYSLFHFQPS